MVRLKISKVYLGIGSNLGQRGENIQNAMLNLERWGVKILRASGIYETEPVGMKNAGWFYNMVVCAETVFLPEELLKAISAIEMAMGRAKKFMKGDGRFFLSRVEEWGSRAYDSRLIDIDILFYGDLTVEMAGLTIPHPRIAERRFVLVPLAEIAPELTHPILKKTVAELLKGCKDKAIVRPLA